MPPPGPTDVADPPPTPPDRASSRRGTLAAGAIGAAAMALVQSADPGVPGNDSLYHLKMARLLPSLGFAQEFPWLHWTVFRDQFVSHHHGFHVFLAPFAWLSDGLTNDLMGGGKAAAVVAMGLTAAVLYRVLLAINVRAPLAWVCLLGLAPWHFWMRLAYIRAPILALPLLLAAVLFAIRRRPVALGLLAFVFTHVYGGAVLFPLVPIALVAGQWLAGFPSRRDLHLLAAAAIGMLGGLIVNPYFPNNIGFLRMQLFETGLGAPADVGNEWKPFNAWFLARMSAPLALLWLACLVRRLRGGQPLDGAGIGLLLLNLGFLFLTIKARRFVEYWPAFALLDAASLARVRTSAGPSGRPVPAPARAALAVACAVAVALTLLTARRSARPSRDFAAFREAMTFLRDHSPPGSLVLTDDWDVFPVCFYYNHHNRFAVGLDPVFTQTRYPELWERYRIITRGRAPADLDDRFPSAATRRVTLDDIADVFNADYVVVAADHPRLFRQLEKRPDRFVRMFPPADAAPKKAPAVSVFRVRATPPNEPPR